MKSLGKKTVEFQEKEIKRLNENIIINNENGSLKHENESSNSDSLQKEKVEL